MTSRKTSALTFTPDPFSTLTDFFSEELKPVLITDVKIAKIYAEELALLVLQGCALYTFQAGEKNKTLATVEKLADRLQADQFGRKDTLIIALGGGIVGDIVGFLASIYLRGVPYIQVPTTLLAMVDSSIGGKTGVNTKFGKNMLGSFYDPFTTIISPSFLKTLPLPEISNGLAEMVKHTVLDSTVHFHELEKNIPAILSRDENILLNMIKKSIQVKLHHVHADPKEKKNIRSFLNFGHTVGHAVEKASNYSIPHGAAISIGMVLESAVAEKELGFTGAKDLRHVLKMCHLPTTLPSSISKKNLRPFMIQDKKNEQDQIVCAVPKAFGKMTILLNPKI